MGDPHSDPFFETSFRRDQLNDRAVGAVGDFMLTLAIVASAHAFLLLSWYCILKFLESRSIVFAGHLAGSPPATPRGGVSDAADNMKRYFLDAAIPNILYWPNIEVLVVIYFSASVAESCSAVLASAASHSFPDRSGTVALAVLGWLFLAFFFIHEPLRISSFTRRHGELWQPAEKVKHYEDVDDRLLRTLHRHHLLKQPALRIRGKYEIPAELQGLSTSGSPPGFISLIDSAGARALLAPMSRWWKRTPSDMHSSLASSWLARVNGQSAVSSLYQYIKLLIHLWFAILTGVVDANSSTDLAGWHVLVLLLATLMLLLGWYASCFTAAGDRLEGIFTMAEVTLSTTSLILRYARALGAGGDAALHVSTWLLAAAVMVALAYPFYDSATVHCASAGKVAPKPQSSKSPSKSPKTPNKRTAQETEKAAAEWASGRRGASRSNPGKRSRVAVEDTSTVDSAAERRVTLRERRLHNLQASYSPHADHVVATVTTLESGGSGGGICIARSASRVSFPGSGEDRYTPAPRVPPLDLATNTDNASGSLTGTLIPIASLSSS